MNHFDLADIRPMDFGKELELAEFEDRGDALRFVASPFRQWKLIYLALMITVIGGLRCLPWYRFPVSLLLFCCLYLPIAVASIARFTCRYVVSISAVELRIRTRVLGMGWTKTIPLIKVSNLHFAPIRVSPRRYGLVFECDGQTCRLPVIILGLDANQIKRMFECRIPQLNLIARSLVSGYRTGEGNDPVKCSFGRFSLLDSMPELTFVMKGKPSFWPALTAPLVLLMAALGTPIASLAGVFLAAGLVMVVLVPIAALNVREVITITPEKLQSRMQCLGFRWTRSFLLKKVCDLRFEPAIRAWLFSSLLLGRYSRRSRLAFQYNFFPRCLAVDIEADEARWVFAAIRRRFPGLIA